MEGKRFDQLARTLATSGSRRRVLGGFLTGVLGGLRIRPASADDSGTSIADASGGDHNHASASDQESAGQDHDHDRDRDRDNNHDRDRNNHDHDGAKAFCRFGTTDCECSPEGSGIFCGTDPSDPVSCQCDGDVCQPSGPQSTVATSCCSCSPDPSDS